MGIIIVLASNMSKNMGKIMIVECSRPRNIPKVVLTLQGSESYHSKKFQAVSPTSTTIKEREGVVILFILDLGDMRRYPERVIVPHGPPSFPKPPLASLPSSANQLQGCLPTSASAPRSHRESLSHMRAFLQETPRYCRRAQALGGRDERRPDGAFNGTYQPTRYRCCSGDAKTPKA